MVEAVKQLDRKSGIFIFIKDSAAFPHLLLVVY